jgi:hypothetical protein
MSDYPDSLPEEIQKRIDQEKDRYIPMTSPDFKEDEDTNKEDRSPFQSDSSDEQDERDQEG